MKKILIVLIVLILGCSKTIKVTQPERTLVQGQKIKLDPWYREWDEKIAVGDPANFYTEFPIYIDAVITVQLKMYENGKPTLVDSSIVVKLDVQTDRPGKIYSIERKNGKAINYTIQFDENDLNYNFVFKAGATVNNKTYFYLVSPKIIEIEGIKASVPITIDGDVNGTDDCRLLTDFNKIPRQRNVNGSASGVQIYEGTKVVK